MPLKLEFVLIKNITRVYVSGAKGANLGLEWETKVYGYDPGKCRRVLQALGRG